LGQDKRIFTNNKAAGGWQRGRGKEKAPGKKAIIKPKNSTNKKRKAEPGVEKSFCVNFKAEPWEKITSVGECIENEYLSNVMLPLKNSQVFQQLRFSRSRLNQPYTFT